MDVLFSWSSWKFLVVSTVLQWGSYCFFFYWDPSYFFLNTSFKAATLPKNVQAILDPDVIPVSFNNCDMLSDHLVILVFRINLNTPLHYDNWLNPPSPITDEQVLELEYFKLWIQNTLTLRYRCKRLPYFVWKIYINVCFFLFSSPKLVKTIANHLFKISFLVLLTKLQQHKNISKKFCFEQTVWNKWKS